MPNVEHADRSSLTPETATVMLVDDEPTTLLVVESFLRAEGYENLVLVDDSRRVLDLVAEVHPDVLLMDRMMPYVGGFEILSAMRADPALAEIPVVILSSGDFDARREALSLGAREFVAKPVDRQELIQRLREILGFKPPVSPASTT